MTRAAIFLILAIAPALAQDSAKSKPSPDRTFPVQVDKLFAKWDSTASPGCALSVMKDDPIIYKRGYGMADLDHDTLMTTETVFHVASISKQFTAAPIPLLAKKRVTIVARTNRRRCLS